MDESAPRTIATGIVATSVASSAFTSIRSIIKHGNTQPGLTQAAALNGAIAAAVFFSIREYAISPILVSTIPQHQQPSKEIQPSYSDIRKTRLLDTSISGAATGAILNAIRKPGQRAILSGTVSVSFLCALIQIAYNEASVTRLKLITRKKEAAELRENPPPPPPIHSIPEPRQQSPPIMGRILDALGMKPLPTEEYIRRLKKTRDLHLAEIQKLEEQIERDRDLSDGK